MTFRDMLQCYFSPSELQAIRATTVGIAGAGGLGSNCAVLLARSGFERFVIADHDTVEWTNLNRQHYFPEHLGRPKVECLGETLRKLNPAIDAQCSVVRVTRANVIEIFGQCGVVVEAFDAAEAKVLLIEALVGTGRPIVGASGLGGLGGSNRIQTRKVLENLYMIGDQESAVGEHMKPYAPCVTVAAAKMADAVLAVVLRREP